MNEQNFVERMKTSDIVEQTDQGTNSSVEISDYFDDHAPVDATLLHEALIEGVIVDDNPIDETVTHETPIDTNIGSLAALLDLDVSSISVHAGRPVERGQRCYYRRSPQSFAALPLLLPSHGSLKAEKS
jgi:hypothetical protein